VPRPEPAHYAELGVKFGALSESRVRPSLKRGCSSSSSFCRKLTQRWDLRACRARDNHRAHQVAREFRRTVTEKGVAESARTGSSGLRKNPSVEPEESEVTSTSIRVGRTKDEQRCRDCSDSPPEPSSVWSGRAVWRGATNRKPPIPAPGEMGAWGRAVVGRS
jgi:hypothetical protein